MLYIKPLVATPAWRDGKCNDAACASTLEAHFESPEGIFVLHPTAGPLPQAHFRPFIRPIVLQDLKRSREGLDGRVDHVQENHRLDTMWHISI